MSDSLGRRIFLAHLELSYRLGRKVTLAEFGELIARKMTRGTAFTAAAVSRWESGIQIPTPQIVEAIAAITHTDPGWISHGRKSAAPRPGRLEKPTTPPPRPTRTGASTPPPLPVSAAHPKARVPRRRT
jgi:transcriptional regulator with XRE-family HTH domain